ncbi:unnamed protein product, partial [Mesorhabditis spiculigera]
MATSNCKYDWFQTETHVTLTILKRGVALEACKALLDPERNTLTITVEGDAIWGGTLAAPVDSSKFVVKCTPAKVEISMPKTTTGRWPALVQTEDAPAASSQAPKKNWDAIEKEAEREEEEATGEAAVDKMFKNIYSNANDDVRRAMMKSYSESNGTVLSTNWDEISKQKTETKPPDSMEFKKWE